MGASASTKRLAFSAAVLARVSLFSNLTHDMLIGISECFTKWSYGVGSIILEEGDRSRDLYIVAEGAIDVVSPVRRTGEAPPVLAVKRKYDYFGASSLVRETVQLCTMRTSEPTILLVLSKEAFDRYPKASHFARVRDVLYRLAQPDVVPLLRSIPFFAHLGSRDTNLLTSLFTALPLSRGDVVCREGERASSFFFILEGSVQVVAEGGSNSKLVCCEGFLQCKRKKLQKSNRMYCELRNNELFVFEAEPGVAYSSPLLTTDSVSKNRKSLNVDASAARQISVIGGVTVAGSKVLKECVVLKGVKDKERGNLFVAYPDGGKKWRLEAPSTQAKLEWIRTIRAGIERAGADGSSADVAVPDTAAVGQGPATSSSSSLPTAPHKNLFVTELGPGSYFGEMSLVADIPRSATLTAKDRSVLLVLEREAFQSFLNLIPDMKGDIELMAKTRSTQNLRSLKLSFLECLSEPKLELLATASKLVSVPTGQCVFKQGDEGYSFYIILHGDVAVSITQTGSGGSQEELIVNRLTTGAYFGEIAVLADQPRLATVTATSPTTLLELDKGGFLAVFSGESNDALVDFELRLIRHNAELRHVIRHPVGLRYFTLALKKEFSQENIDFWKQCEDFRAMAAKHDGDEVPPKELLLAARTIFLEFVSDAATRQVNISSRMREAVETALHIGQVKSDLFDSAQTEIYMLMEKDNFVRFRKSELFKQLLHEIDPSAATQYTAASVLESAKRISKDRDVRRASYSVAAREDSPWGRAKGTRNASMVATSPTAFAAAAAGHSPHSSVDLSAISIPELLVVEAAVATQPDHSPRVSSSADVSVSVASADDAVAQLEAVVTKPLSDPPPGVVAEPAVLVSHAPAVVEDMPATAGVDLAPVAVSVEPTPVAAGVDPGDNAASVDPAPVDILVPVVVTQVVGDAPVSCLLPADPVVAAVVPPAEVVVESVAPTLPPVIVEDQPAPSTSDATSEQLACDAVTAEPEAVSVSESRTNPPSVPDPAVVAPEPATLSPPAPPVEVQRGTPPASPVTVTPVPPVTIEPKPHVSPSSTPRSPAFPSRHVYPLPRSATGSPDSATKEPLSSGKSARLLAVQKAMASPKAPSASASPALVSPDAKAASPKVSAPPPALSSSDATASPKALASAPAPAPDASADSSPLSRVAAAKKMFSASGSPPSVPVRPTAEAPAPAPSTVKRQWPPPK